jgi:hypothetical protein
MQTLAYFGGQSGEILIEASCLKILGLQVMCHISGLNFGTVAANFVVLQPN